MAVTAVNIVSNALVLLGGNTIANFDEESAEARIAASLYETTYLALQTMHRWRFNSKKGSLNRLADAPISEYNYAFQLPVDLLYLIKTESQAPYEIYGRKLYTNQTEVTIDYQFRVNEENLPAYYVKALEYSLASQFAVPLTGDLNKAQFYSGEFMRALKSAKFNDSTQSPSASIRANPYVDIRY